MALRRDRRVQRRDRYAGGDGAVGQGMAGVGGLGGGDTGEDHGDDGDAPEFHGTAPYGEERSCRAGASSVQTCTPGQG